MIKTQLHSVFCNKSQGHLYKIVSNAKLWEDIFEPCQSVLLLSKDDDFEHVEICALIDNVPVTWRFSFTCLSSFEFALSVCDVLFVMRDRRHTSVPSNSDGALCSNQSVARLIVWCWF